MTKQPATVPTFEMLEHLAHLDHAEHALLRSGASMPDSAAFTSSTAS